MSTEKADSFFIQVLSNKQGTVWISGKKKTIDAVSEADETIRNLCARKKVTIGCLLVHRKLLIL